MPLVGSSLLLGALGSLLFPLLVRRVCHFVLHFATEFGDAARRVGITGWEFGVVVVVMMLAVFVAAFGGYIGLAWYSECVFDLLSLLGI